MATLRLRVSSARFEDVEDAFSTLVQSESRRDEIVREIGSPPRGRDLSEQSYKAGVIPLTDVLDRGRQLPVAKDDLALTRETAARAAVGSFQAQGRGRPDYGRGVLPDARSDWTDMDEQHALPRLHYELIHGLLGSGVCPTNSELADRMGMTLTEIEEHLRSLSAIHGAVLHPHECEPWIIHPFSLTPTLNWVEGRRVSWWAPCVWCAFGIATLVGGKVNIHTRIGAEKEPLTIPVADGQPVDFDWVCVHFAIPPARAWDNVHEHCSMVLPFRSEDQIQEWCSRHRLPFGQSVPMRQVAHLARMWYGSHANVDWHKWAIEEAQDIFNKAGLRSDFWDIGAMSGRF